MLLHATVNIQAVIAYSTYKKMRQHIQCHPTLIDMPSAEYHTSFRQDRLTYDELYAAVVVLTEMLQ